MKSFSYIIKKDISYINFSIFSIFKSYLNLFFTSYRGTLPEILKILKFNNLLFKM